MIRGLVAVDRGESAKPFEPIIRPRVMDVLSRATSARIAIIVAPAGFGKSVALRHYLAQTHAQHVRYAVRKQHASLLSFARGFSEALEPIAPGLARSITSAYEKSARSVAAAAELATWAHAHIKGYQGTIVIDDLHEASDSQASAFLASLVDLSKDSPGTRWLFATRDASELPVASWLAYGELDVPVDEVDLKITLDEALQLTRNLGIAIRGDDLKELVELTAGWPVALAFALRATTRSADFKRIASGARELVYAYLAEQIFRKLRDDERAFLLDTCVFPTIDIELLSKHGWPDAACMVAELRRHTSFINAEGRGTFRYHELFRQFLEDELLRGGHEQLRRGLIAAGSVYQQVRRFAEALRLYIQAEAQEQIVAILGDVGFDLLDMGHADILTSALGVLSEERRSPIPALLALRGAVESMAGRYDRGDAFYEAALKTVSEHSTLGLVVDRYAQNLSSRMQLHKARELLETYDPKKAEQPNIRARMISLLASIYAHVGRTQEAALLIEQALAISASILDPAVVGTTMHRAGSICFQLGEYDRAESYARSVIDLCRREGLDDLAARSSTLLYAIESQRGDTSSCLWVLQQLGIYGERTGNRAHVFFSLAATFEIETERGDKERLADLERSLLAFDTTVYARATEMLSPSFALQAAWKADFAKSMRFLEGSAHGQVTAARRALRWSEIGVYAAAAGQRAEADTALRSAFFELRTVNNSRDPITHHVWRAKVWLSLAQLLTGRTASANKLLLQLERDAANLPPAVKLLAEAVRAIYMHVETALGHAEIERSLEVLRRNHLGGYARFLQELPLPARSHTSPFGLLTKTELMVLRALAQGDSSKAIGVSLSRSTLTVDCHVRSIVRKLGCSGGRREAVSLAREHGLV